MNVAQHAGNILDAWQYGDRAGFGTALDLAARRHAPSFSNFESERSELLESIVEHLRQLPEPSLGSGPAATLLSHLRFGSQNGIGLSLPSEKS